MHINKSRKIIEPLLVFAIIMLVNIFFGAIGVSGASGSQSPAVYQKRVFDQAGLLSEQEEADIISAAEKIQDADVFIVTVLNNPYGKDQAATDKYCNVLCVKEQSAGNKNSLVLCIDMDTGYVLISSYGDIRSRITSTVCNNITGKVFTYADAREYYECFYEMILEIKTVLDSEPETDSKTLILYGAIAGVIGVTLIVIGCVMPKAKNKGSKGTTEGDKTVDEDAYAGTTKSTERKNGCGFIRCCHCGALNPSNAEYCEACTDKLNQI